MPDQIFCYVVGVYTLDIDFISITIMPIVLSCNETLNIQASQLSGVVGRPFQIEDFTYENNIVRDLMTKHLQDTDTDGILVSFKAWT